MIFAYGNVKIVIRDSLTITAERLEYDANDQIADLFGNIHMKNKSSELVTPRMTFYREQEYGKYFNGGILYDGDNELRSNSGYYFTEDELAFFKGNVLLTNPKYTLMTDTLGYDTHSESAIFNAPTLIQDKDDNTIYTERGFYDTKMNLAYFYRNPYLQDSTYRLEADTIFYDRDMDYGRAIGNLVLTKADSSITVYGQYGEFKQFESVSYLTDSAYALQVFDDDTLYVFADTLFAYQDSVWDEKGDSLRPNNRLYAYYQVKFFMRSMQGKTDSLVYLLDDSIIQFFRKPVLWSDETQVLGDTVRIFLANDQVDSMAIGKEAFIVTEQDTVGFNQIKGKWIHAKFRENDLWKMWVKGNSESIYFAEEEGKGYTGMNQARCNEMFIRFLENEISRISFIDQAEGVFSPMHEIVFSENKLDGFRWLPEERPVRPAGVFPQEVERYEFEKHFRDSILKLGTGSDSLIRPGEADTHDISPIPSLVPDSLSEGRRVIQEEKGKEKKNKKVKSRQEGEMGKGKGKVKSRQAGEMGKGKGKVKSEQAGKKEKAKKEIQPKAP